MGQSQWLLGCALAACVFGGRMHAQEMSRSIDATEAGRRINAALHEPLRSPMEFVETPLNSIMDVIQEEYDIPVQFDEAALDAVAASPETEVTVNIRNVSLRSALDLILSRTEDLTYIIDQESLIVTTEDEANMRLDVRVYRIDDLIALEGRGALLASDDDYQRLIELITSNVERHSWAVNKTGQGEITAFSPGMLVISQTQRVQEQIEKLLETLRSTKAEVLAAAGDSGENDALVTRGIPINPEAAKTGTSQNTIRDTLMQSVRWDEASGELGERVSIAVLPTHVLVRHTPQVVRQVLQAVRDMELEAAEEEPSRASGGGLGGGGFRAGSSESAVATGEAGQAGAGRGRRGGF